MSASGSASTSVGGMSGGSGGASGSGGAASGGAGGAMPSGDPAIHWFGRTEPTANGARLDWPGTGFTARFNGTGAHVTLKTNADYFEVIVDGQTSVLSTTSGSRTYDLAKNLSAGEHTVTLWRRTEPLNGLVEVGPITFDGTLLPPPTAATKHLEVIGDSISVGFGTECKTAGEAFSFATENNYITYEALTARRFAAELYTEAWSGIGMYSDLNGTSKINAANEMPARYQYTCPSDTTIKWDFSRYTPDAVVILLGTNDFNGSGGDPGSGFADAYTKFVTDLRAHYARARFYLAVSPMIGGAARATLTKYLDQVITARAGANDENLALLTFDPVASGAYTCGHPNAATHQIMAGVLEAALTNDLGWQPAM